MRDNSGSPNQLRLVLVNYIDIHSCARLVYFLLRTSLPSKSNAVIAFFGVGFPQGPQ